MIAELQITYFDFGQHYYGSLVIDSVETELTYKINNVQAAMFNKLSEHKNHHAGDTTLRFWSREAVQKAAIAQIKDNPEILLLLEDGNKSNPGRVIYSKLSKQLTRRLKAIRKRYDGVLDKCTGRFYKDPWAMDRAAADRIYYCWGRAMIELGIEHG